MAPKLSLSLSMVIFGTIGLFVRYIPLPSAVIAFVRAAVGVVFLLAVMALRKQKPDFAAIKKNGWKLFFSSFVMAFNWILLFEAYRYTTVATATLCYYFAPIFVTLASPFVLGEKLTGRKCLCILVALVGMVLVSGVLDTGISDLSELSGVLLGLGAAVLYATVILINKKLTDISAYDRTVSQLGIAAVVMAVYLLVTGPEISGLTVSGGIMLLVVGVIHTGFAYWLYFGSLEKIPAQTAAIFSYLDPVVAILLSATLLQEGMTLAGAVGAVLILGATFVSEK